MSQYNSNREKQDIPNLNDSKRRRMALSCGKKTINIKSDFYCLSCLHSFATENKLESHRKVCQNEDFCNVVRLSEDNKMLEFNQISKI